jgi:TRAP-type transport system small permease protein
MSSRVERFSQAINTIVEKILLVIGSAICIILFAQVISRYAGASLGWSEEVSRHLLVAITFLGSTAAYKRANFIGLKGIGQWLGPTGARIILLLLQLLTLACFLTICGFGVQYTLKAWHHTSASLQIPMAFPFAVIPMAAAILAVHVTADIAQTLRRRAS